MYTVIIIITIISQQGSVAVTSQQVGEFKTVTTCAEVAERMINTQVIANGVIKVQTAECALLKF